MKYFSMFSGIGGFENGIERAFNGGNVEHNSNQATTQHSQRNKSIPKGQQGQGDPVADNRSIDDSQNTNRTLLSDRQIPSDTIARDLEAIKETSKLGCEIRQNGNGILSEGNGIRNDSESVVRQRDLPNNKINGNFKCIGYSEIDKYATAIYDYHYGGHKNYGDATKINTDDLPDFDLLVGGFPCQAFSIAGKRLGFDDTRGTLFFEIARILKAKRPKHFVLENVKGLLSHDNGRTFKTIIATLVELGYGVEWQVLNSKNHGVPQNRERVFIVGHLGGEGCGKVFPIGEGDTIHYGQGNEGVSKSLTATSYKGVGNDGTTLIPQALDLYNNKAHSDRTPALTEPHHNSLRLLQNARIRRLTPTECERLQGFPDGWTKYGSFKPENKKGKCAKQEVIALVTDGNKQSIGFNWCKTPQDKCPRSEGEDYSKCKSICNQNSHAEIEALKNFKGDLSKAKLYIYGHNRICEECKLASQEMAVVFGLPPIEISDSQRYKCLGNAVTTNVVVKVIKTIFK